MTSAAPTARFIIDLHFWMPLGGEHVVTLKIPPGDTVTGSTIAGAASWHGRRPTFVTGLPFYR